MYNFHVHLFTASSQEFPSSTSAAEPAAPCSFSVLRLVFHLLVGMPYLVSTVLLGLIYRDRRRGKVNPANV